MGPMGKGTMGSIFDTVSSAVSLVHTCACLVVAQVVASLSITCRAVEIWTPNSGRILHVKNNITGVFFAQRRTYHTAYYVQSGILKLRTVGVQRPELWLIFTLL